ncbi:MAG TPA: phage tail tape measure C-terminal domain-containing protein, partial [Anaerolineales bacterium]|nr:phage tail tape measure C-terminal domain-containing protein [Anaerolineales bacterium]
GDQALQAVADLNELNLLLEDTKSFFGGIIDGASEAGNVLSAVFSGDFERAQVALRRGLEADENIWQGALANRKKTAKAFAELNLTIPGIATQAPFIFANQRSLPSQFAKSGIDENALQNALAGVKSPEAKSSGRKAKEGKSDAEKEAERLKEAYDRLNQSLAEQVALFGQTSEAAKLRYDLEHGELAKLTQGQKDALIVQAETLDTLRSEAEVKRELDEANKRREESVAQVLEDIQTERDLLGQSVEYQDTYNKLKYAGVDANSAFGQSIIEANSLLHEEAQAVARQTELMDEFRSGLGDAFADFVTGAKSAKEAFTDFFNDMAAKITRMIAERWIEQLFGQQGTTGGGASGGNWIASLFGALFGGARATGGSVMPGMFYRINENGPEMLSMGGRDYLMMGAQAGRVSTTDRSASKVVNQSFYTLGTETKRTQEQKARQSGQAARRAMVRS